LWSGFRVFRYQPAFTICVAATAAVGLAANAALFAIVDGAFLRGLPFPQADRLIHLELKPLDFYQLSIVDRGRVGELQQRLMQNASFAGPASFELDERVEDAVEFSDEWRSLRVREVTFDFFDVLAVRPRLGRTFSEEDSRGAPRAVILSHDLWTRQFGADDGVIGKVVRIPGTDSRGFCEVVGVMPEGFAFPAGVHLWIVGPRPRAPVGAEFVGRLTNAGTIASVRAQLPEMTVIPLEQYVRPSNATMMAYLLAGSVCLFLVAWLQVGSLLLSRLLRRVPEFRLKIALGATPQRLRLECLGEVLLLLSAAVLLACALAPLLNAVAVRQLPESLTVDRSVTFGLRSVLFLSVLGVLGAAMWSIIPLAVVHTSHDERFTGREGLGGRSNTLSRSRKTVFLAQVAAATALIYLTTLVALSYERVTSVPLGFNPRGLWAVALPIFESPPAADRAAARSMLSAHRVRKAETFRALAARPEIVSLATTSFSPMQSGGTEPVLLRAESDPSARTVAGRRAYVSSGFTDTFGITLASGREILPSEADTISESAQIPGNDFALADSALAKHLAQFGDPIGQMVVRAPYQRVRIVGVISDVRVERPDEPPVPTLFVFTKAATAGGRLMIRVRGDSIALAPMVRDAMRGAWGSERTAEVFSVENWVEAATADYRARVVVLTLMVLFSIPVSGLGLIGAVTHVCTERRYEFAVRVALGSTPRALRYLLLKQFAALGAIGLSAGAVGAIAIGNAMAVLLFGVAAEDPRVALFVAAGMITMVSAAVLIPAAAVTSPELGVALKE
jgi:predicted permease